jgi:GNAT superfamily N-acetyltransferase
MDKICIISMEIRVFRKQDAASLSRLIRKTLLDLDRKDYPESVINNQCENYSKDNIIRHSDKKEIYIAAEGKAIIGTAGLEKNWISGVFVDPDSQNKGVGTILMDHVEGIARKNRYPTVMLGANLAASGFYRKRGYYVLKVMENPELGRLVQMEKPLSLYGSVTLLARKLFFSLKSLFR